MTKAGVKASIAALDQEIVKMEKRCAAAGVDVRPWESRDHPLLLEHWALLQRRWELKRQLSGWNRGWPGTDKDEIVDCKSQKPPSRASWDASDGGRTKVQTV